MLSLKMIIATPLWFLVAQFLFALLCFVLMLMFVWKNINRWLSDRVYFFDKNGRWKEVITKVRDEKPVIYKDMEYIRTEKSGNLSSRGKLLLMYDENNPKPKIPINYKGSDTVSAKTLKDIIDSRHVEQIAHPSNRFIDTMLLLGAIGGILAAISSVIVLLITLGIIKPPVT